MRRKKRDDGTEYGAPYCWFTFPKDLHARYQIKFEEREDGSIKVSFISICNDPRMSQHYKFHLQSWFANCDMQIVLDEEQAIRYLVKYASKPEKRCNSINELIKSILPSHLERNEESKEDNEESKENDQREVENTCSITGSKLIQQIALRSIGERNKSQQEIMHLLLNEAIYNSDFSYVNISLDKYEVQTLRRRQEQEDGPAFHKNIFDYYATRDASLNNMSFLSFCKKFEVKQNELQQRNRRIVVITFPQRSSSTTSPKYHLYCKNFLIKHKPWRDSIHNVWGGRITDPNSENPSETLEDGHDIAKEYYIQQFQDFSSTIDISSLEMFHSDVDRLHRVREESDTQYIEEEEALEEIVAPDNPQDNWMDFAGETPFNDAAILDSFAPILDPTVNWCEIRKTSNDLVDEAATHLKEQKERNTNLQREARTIDSDRLNREQKFVNEIVKQLLENSNKNIENKPLLVIGGPGTGKSTVIHQITKTVNSLELEEVDVVLKLGTTGTAAFVICGSTCHSKLFLPINRTYTPLKGDSLKRLQDTFKNIKVIIIDEVSMMGKKMLSHIDKRLREASGKNNKPFGDFFVIFVGDYQQLPPVGDTAVFDGECIVFQ